MGWFFGHLTKQELIDDLLGAERGWAVVDHSLIGNNLWVVGQREDSRRFIRLYILGANRNAKYYRWGYKPIYESEGPYATNCPERLLAQSDETSEYAVTWRERCRAARAGRKGSAAFIAGLEPGDVFIHRGRRVVFTRRLTHRSWRSGRTTEYILGRKNGDATEYRWSKQHIRPCVEADASRA